MKCKICNKEKTIFRNSMCQSCYRKISKEYSQYFLRDKKLITNTKHANVVLFFFSGMNKKEIAKELGMTVRNVDIIIKKYCYRGNDLGEPRNFKQ